MHNPASETLARAITGQTRRPRYGVRGTDRHGEEFTIERYFTYADAQDFAQEVNDGGGEATAYLLRAWR